MPKGSHKVFPLSEKVKVLDLLRKEKKLSAEVAKIYGKNKSIHELRGRKKKFVLVLQFASQTA